MSPTSTATSDGILFAPDAGTSAYLCRKDHRPNAHPSRNRWCLTPDGEYGVFADAEAAQWRDSRPQLWGILPGLAQLGLDDRFIAKFPNVTNPGDPWHGYPVSALLDRNRDLEHRPESELVDRWLSASLITQQQALRIKKGKV